MVNALTANVSSLLSTSNSSLMMTRIAERLYADMRQRTDAIDESYQARIDSVSARSGTVSGRLRDAEKVVKATENAKEQVTDIKGFLRDMKRIVAKAENNPAASELYSKQFNEKIQEINQTANRYSGDYNLIGRPNGATLLPEKKSIQVSDNGTNLTVQALYAGTSFNIVGTGADEGFYYKNNPTANVMYKVESLSEDDKRLSVVGHDGGRISGVTVGSDDTITFKVDDGPSGSGGTTFTGTLQKGGLELMPAWYYEELSTTDGIAAAKEAIRDAEANLRKVEFSVTTVKARAQPKLRSLQTEKQNLSDEISALARDQFTKIAEIEDATRAQYNAVESSLNNQSKALSGYQSILRGAASGTFLNTMS
ncbi:hypothetical protein F1188_05015 [Roseospira marina]|uniref:Flagellin n=1 Tax=Roseospira marina TaxID=140057 RepID=A0A5M6IG96_9PROT|nr:hypothetical protein [Roseospira marina]KAA5606695.1 hypothetical protein F1188_05015 [Roseospira marina]MBB4313892.1 phage host-nuclease inhibitor protein Gam [Roseospira marina]MBB5087054.1 ribosome recycling factor [Roseospira marina]